MGGSDSRGRQLGGYTKTLHRIAMYALTTGLQQVYKRFTAGPWEVYTTRLRQVAHRFTAGVRKELNWNQPNASQIKKTSLNQPPLELAGG